MQTVIIHGKKLDPRTEGGTGVSPRAGRPDAELWGVTRANVKFWNGGLLDWTRWFDVHPLTATADFPGIPERRPEAWRWMCQQDGSRPIYLQDPQLASDPEKAAHLFAMVPGATVFPLDRVLAAVQPDEWFFLSQVGFMLVFAKLEGKAHVILNGIGVPHHVEHQHAHRDQWHWIGWLRGQGVRVSVEGKSCYHTPPKLYAYEKHNFAELADARRSLAGPSLAEIRDIEHENERDRRRGRPPRVKVPS